MEPLHADALIGAQRGFQAGPDRRRRGPRTRSAGFRQPGPGRDVRPFGVDRGGSSPATDAPASSRMASTKLMPFLSAGSRPHEIDAWSSQASTIDLDPLAAQQHETIGPASSSRFPSRSAVRRPASRSREIEHAVQPEDRRLRPPTVAATRGRAGRLARHLAGMRTMTPALSSSGRLWRKRDASAGPSAADGKSRRRPPSPAASRRLRRRAAPAAAATAACRGWPPRRIRARPGPAVCAGRGPGRRAAVV